MNIIESDLSFNSLTSRNKTTKGVIHHFAGSGYTIEKLHQMHKDQGWSGCGYHFYIRKDGKIYRGRPELSVGAHVSGHNSYTIGICFEGNYEIDKVMPGEQEQSGIELVSYLKNKYGIDFARHRDFIATACPGVNFPFNEIVNGIVGVNTVSTNDAYPIPISNADWINLLNAEVKAQGFSSYPVVKKGAKGKITKLIQERLGFTPPDNNGNFDLLTVMCVKAFQLEKGLVADGIVGTNTWNALIKM